MLLTRDKARNNYPRLHIEIRVIAVKKRRKKNLRDIALNFATCTGVKLAHRRKYIFELPRRNVARRDSADWNKR